MMNSLQQRVSWNQNLPINLYIHESFLNQPNKDEYMDALKKAMDAWTKSLGKELFVIAGVGISGPANPQKDGMSGIYFMDTWEESKPTEQARTTIYWKGEQIVEGDIRINAKNFQFFTGDSLTTTAVDLQSLFTHELGHLLGLSHDNQNGSVMNERLASGVTRRDIGNLDISSLKCEY